MTPAPDDAPETVEPCPLMLRRQAVMQLAAASHTAGRRELAQAIDAHLEAPDHDWDGLRVVLQDGELEAALWVQPLPGNMAQLWQSDATGQRAAALLADARRWVAEQGFRLCQTVLTPDQSDAARALESAGMTLVAPLEYLTAPVPDAGTLPETPAIHQRPWDSLDSARQLALLDAVQQDSLDCVALCDVLDAEALLAGFLQQDEQAPAHWRVIQTSASGDAAPAGVLLLAPRPEVQGMELLLMGLVPAARGQGLGQAVLNAAFAEARNAGAQRLLLSVDMTNTPARRLYQAAGFVCYSRQQVYAWLS